jgi:hypothetical protein
MVQKREVYRKPALWTQSYYCNNESLNLSCSVSVAKCISQSVKSEAKLKE